MQNVINGSQRVVKELRTPEPMQLDDWENEGGAPPVVNDDELASMLSRLGTNVSGAIRQLAQAVRERPVVTLGAVFALGLVFGGGARQLKSGKLLMAVAAKPLFALATGMLLKKK